jgi:Cd2+/Zn2+-exporting ATPase
MTHQTMVDNFEGADPPGKRTETRVVKRQRPWWQNSEIMALILSGVLLLAGLVAEKLLALELPAVGLYLATLAVGGFFPARSALRALHTRRLTISNLVVVAALGAVALGVYEEAALLIVVFSLGDVLEEYTSDRARGSIRALMALTPLQAQRSAPDGLLEAVPVERLMPGDIVVVRPGERLPTDGVVVSGASAVDQSPVTGESLPVEISPGATVFGGTINGTGALEIRVTKEYADTILARIIRQVEQAQANQGQAQRFADRFSAIYTPSMFVLAALVAVVPPLLGGSFREWFYRALVLLAVSCSCGLIISVPVAVVATISRAARDGILIKGGAYLETLGRIRAIAFDKTGTLTRGLPKVTDVIPLDGYKSEEVLRLAASVEAVSEHPLAGAILRAAQERDVQWIEGQDLKAFPGVGVEATVAGQRLFIGKPNGLASNEVAQQLVKLENEGKTAVVLARDNQPVALIAVSDQVRDGAKQIVASLHKLGIQKMLMLTGDNQRTAVTIARQVGIIDWRAGLLPEDKTVAVKSLKEQYGLIAMVGDGVNDAPALATADLGIAMGAAGTDVALETADVALMADDLTKLPLAIRLSRRALANIHQNIALSLVTVAFLDLAALSGWLSLTSGLLLNEGTALLIIFNGLRLLTPIRR